MLSKLPFEKVAVVVVTTHNCTSFLTAVVVLDASHDHLNEDSSFSDLLAVKDSL